jgi:hypothetical protein
MTEASTQFLQGRTQFDIHFSPVAAGGQRHKIHGGYVFTTPVTFMLRVRLRSWLPARESATVKLASASERLILLFD